MSFPRAKAGFSDRICEHGVYFYAKNQILGCRYRRPTTVASVNLRIRRQSTKETHRMVCLPYSLLVNSGGRIRFSAEKPRPGKQSTGLFAWTGHSNPSPKHKRDTPNGVSLLWWGRTDSNHRSDTQQIYSLSPLATRELPHILFFCLSGGAGRRTRTPDLLITNQLLYRLSYTGGSNRTRLL